MRAQLASLILRLPARLYPLLPTRVREWALIQHRNPPRVFTAIWQCDGAKWTKVWDVNESLSERAARLGSEDAEEGRRLFRYDAELQPKQWHAYDQAFWARTRDLNGEPVIH